MNNSLLIINCRFCLSQFFNVMDVSYAIEMEWRDYLLLMYLMKSFKLEIKVII